MKSFVLSILIFLSVLITHAKESEAVVIWAKDGSKISYNLQTSPTMTFSTADLIITTDVLQINYPLNNIIRYTFEKTEDASISEIKEDIGALTITDNTMEFSNLQKNSIIKVFTIKGGQILSECVKEGGEYSISTASLVPDIYIVSVNDFKYKFVKK